jgi:hypothetical protein
MGWNRRDEDWQADHHRDTLKHEPRPGDRGFSAPRDEFPARFERALSTAEDIANCVMRMKNVTEAAALIKLYADGKVREASDAQT